MAIRQLNAPDNLGINPSDRGTDAVAGAARRIGGFFNQVGGSTEQLGADVGRMWRSLGQDASSGISAVGDVAVKYMDHQQVSKGAADGAQLMSDLNQQWEDRAKNADPNDPTVAAKFRDEVLEPELDKFKEGFSTENSQAWAEHFADNYRNHMFQKTAATMSALAGEAVKVNMSKTVNGLASAVAVDPTPSSIDNAFNVIDHSIGGMVHSSPTLSAETAASVTGEQTQHAKEQIVRSAVVSMITKNPGVDLEAIQKKYGEYIKGDEMKMFQSAAKVQAKQNALIDKQTLETNLKISEQKVRASTNRAIADNVSFDAHGEPIIDPNLYKQALETLKSNPDAPNAGEAFRTITSWGQSQVAKGAKPIDDAATKTDLTDRMFSPDKPTTTLDLMKARAEGKISDHTFQAMHGLVQELEQAPLKGPIWQDTVSAVKGELVLSGVGLPGKDIVGEGNYAKWAQTFIPQYLAQSRAGTLPANALDVNDPKSLISQSMAPFKRTVAQRANDYAASLGGITGTSPRNDTMPAIPAPAERQVGSIYETPRGKMKWTGTGWVTP